MTSLALTIATIPFITFILLNFLEKLRWADKLAIVSQGLMLVLSGVLFVRFQAESVVVRQQWEWFQVGRIHATVGIYLDFRTVIMLLTITLISFLVHLFSQTYMKDDEGYVRYFSYLGLFTFSMIGLVIADNLLLIYVFWELVGLSSYLLIGFWRSKPLAVRAAKKAFLVNRVGDAGFLAAILVLFFAFGTLHLEDLAVLIKQQPMEDEWIGQVVAVGVLLGAFAKSAQLPFSVWLPDAMEGPTPVSALIHAATMVAAGVYLVIRLSFVLSPDIAVGMAFIGAVTAFLAACAALTQMDIKKVLAYSTISQLGYMMMSVGIGAGDIAFFHLITHAFFKAGLFLGAGAVIYALHQRHGDIDAQDIRNMGGLRKYMPVTFWTFLICSASLVGIPFFSGFLSKEAILIQSLEIAYTSAKSFLWLIPVLAFSTVALTAFYMTRLIGKVFLGRNTYATNEVSIGMKIPLIALALFSLAPLYSLNNWFANSLALKLISSFVVALVSVALVLSGILAAYFWQIFNRRASGFWGSLSWHFFYLDYLYDLTIRLVLKVASALERIEVRLLDAFTRQVALVYVIAAHIIAWLDRFFIDGFVNFFVWLIAQMGYANRWIQNGRLQHYLLIMFFSLIGMIFWLVY